MADAPATRRRAVDAIRDTSIDDGQAVAETEADGTAQPDAKSDEYISKEDALRIRRKIDWHIMPLMCCEYRPSSKFSEYTFLSLS